MVVHAFHSGIQESEAGDSDWEWEGSGFQASQDYNETVF